mmetsp:Transcript_8697/g.22701  ORF Transcript_8697/g.22701 Transcript_8697/m.22701 type:complete len:419 (-) Transcript_8697:155-1411(-)
MVPHTSMTGMDGSWGVNFRRNTILTLLVAQITLSALLMRYARTSQLGDSRPKFRASVVVLVTEAVKLPICFLGASFSVGGTDRLWHVLHNEILTLGTLKCAVPAFAYTLQGNLLFVATANLETPIFQVTYQTKTLFTALFSVLLLGRRLVLSQWAALVLLFFGTVAATDLNRSGTAAGPAIAGPSATVSARIIENKEDPYLGLAAVLVAAVLSSSSSVYFEMMLKHEPVHSCSKECISATGAGSGDLVLWIRNLQLGIFALPLAATAAFVQDGRHIFRDGALAGFDGIVWAVVFVNGMGGLLVSATMKYADNIVKCFATALAIISGTFLSLPVFGVQLSPMFLLGAGFTIFASILYSWLPPWSAVGNSSDNLSAAPICTNANGNLIGECSELLMSEKIGSNHTTSSKQDPLADSEGCR